MFSTDSHLRPNYIVHVSKNVTFLGQNIFDPRLVKSANVEPVDIEGRLYLRVPKESKTNHLYYELLSWYHENPMITENFL